jgi:hypothetical protein
MCWQGILCLLITFPTLLHVKLTYYKGLHINTTYIFNINLIHETYEHQNQGLITLKLSPISLVSHEEDIEIDNKKNDKYMITRTKI